MIPSAFCHCGGPPAHAPPGGDGGDGRGGGGGVEGDADGGGAGVGCDGAGGGGVGGGCRSCLSLTSPHVAHVRKAASAPVCARVHCSHCQPLGSASASFRRCGCGESGLDAGRRYRQTGHWSEQRSHRRRQLAWKRWAHGVLSSCSPLFTSSMHTVHVLSASSEPGGVPAALAMGRGVVVAANACPGAEATTAAVLLLPPPPPPSPPPPPPPLLDRGSSARSATVGG